MAKVWLCRVSCSSCFMWLRIVIEYNEVSSHFTEISGIVTYEGTSNDVLKALKLHWCLCINTMHFTAKPKKPLKLTVTLPEAPPFVKLLEPTHWRCPFSNKTSFTSLKISI